MSDSVLFRVEGALAWISLNRPAVRNAINDAMRDAFLAVLARVSADPAIRAVVLTATGDAFCTGADLWGGHRDAQTPPDPPDPPHPGMARALMKQNSQRLIRSLLELEKPIVAAVNGV